MGCLFRHASFYHSVLVKVGAPVVAIAALGCWPLGKALLHGSQSSHAATMHVKSLAMLLIEVVLPSIATSLIQVFPWCVSACARGQF
jgi:hypothetical protein